MVLASNMPSVPHDRFAGAPAYDAAFAGYGAKRASGRPLDEAVQAHAVGSLPEVSSSAAAYRPNEALYRGRCFDSADNA